MAWDGSSNGVFSQATSHQRGTANLWDMGLVGTGKTEPLLEAWAHTQGPEDVPMVTLVPPCESLVTAKWIQHPALASPGPGCPRG